MQRPISSSLSENTLISYHSWCSDALGSRLHVVWDHWSNRYSSYCPPMHGCSSPLPAQLLQSGESRQMSKTTHILICRLSLLNVKMFLDSFPTSLPDKLSFPTTLNSHPHKEINKKRQDEFANKKQTRCRESSWCVWLQTRIPRYRERETHSHYGGHSSCLDNNQQDGGTRGWVCRLRHTLDINCKLLHSSEVQRSL